MRTFLVAVWTGLLLGVVTNPAAAQDRQRSATPRSGSSATWKWWLDEKVKAALLLSERQTKTLDQIFEAARPMQIELWRQLRAAEKEVSAILAAEVIDEGKAVLAIERAEFGRYKLTERRQLMLLRMMQQLSPTQRKQFEDAVREFSERGNRGRNRGRRPRVGSVS